MLKLIYYVPDENLEETKKAILQQVGGIGEYTDCAWQILGTGQFKPQQGADPHIGEIGQLEKWKNGGSKFLCLMKRRLKWLRL